MNSINLLPPEIKKNIGQAKKNKKVLSFYLRTILILIVTILIAGFAYFYFNLQLKNANESLSEKEQGLSKFGSLEAESKKIAERIGIIRQITASSNNWSVVIEELQKIMPEGIYLTSVKMDANQKTRCTVSGVARSKQQVASLRELMEKSTKFEFVDIETSSTVLDPKTQKEIESFTLSFSIEKGAIK